MQHRFTKGVDGLDLETARRLQRAGKELAGQVQPGGIGASPFKLRQLRGQRLVINAGPAGQTVEYPVGHLGRGGLGVGQA